MPSLRSSRLDPASRIALALAFASLAGCGGGKATHEDEAGRANYSCKLSGEHIVVRLESDEVRILMPDGDRVILYRIPSGPGVRYSNGTYELRGSGAELTFLDNGVAKKLESCELIPQTR